MKILLIEPAYSIGDPLTWIPIGKGYLATQVRPQHDVQIWDLALHQMDDDILRRRLRDLSPDVVGTGGMTLQRRDTRRIARIVREELPEALLIGGGVHLTALPDDGFPDFDLVCIGEGERTFADVVSRFSEARRRDAAAYFDVLGLALPGGSRTLQRHFVDDMDILGRPAYDLLDVPAYHDFLVGGQRGISIMTGRGCPFACHFCASPLITRRRMRGHSIPFVLSQMEDLSTRYGFGAFRIMDDNFAATKDRAIALADAISDHRHGWTLNCLTHVNTADARLFDSLRRAGMQVVALGIESADDRVLRISNKHTTQSRQRRAIDLLHRAGIEVEGLFMVGLPGDTEESMSTSVNFAIDTQIEHRWFQFTTPFPGSHLWDSWPQFGTMIDNDINHFDHQRPVFVPHGLDVETLVRYRDAGLQGRRMSPKHVTVTDTEW